MVTTMGFLQYYLKSSTKRGWEMSSLLVAIQLIFFSAIRNNESITRLSGFKAHTLRLLKSRNCSTEVI